MWKVIVCVCVLSTAILQRTNAQEEPPAATQPASATSVSSLVPVGPIDPQSVNNRDVLLNISKQARKLYEGKKTVPWETLVSQLSRKSVKLTLPPAQGGPAMKNEDLYTRGCESTIIVGAFQDKPRFRITPASGFILTSSGVAVTNYHVFIGPKSLVGAVASTHDGNVYGIKEILAADEQMDIAIVQLDGDGFTPLPLAERAAVGSDIFVISGPVNRFWFFSRGIVAGYTVIKRKDQPVDTLEITADYARGSSGAPVLSLNGEAVGMVSSTSSVYYNKDDPNTANDQQMVFKYCVTSKQILSLIERQK